LGTALVHEPLRLSVIVEAPRERIAAIISRNQVLRSLFENDWISLTARDDRAGEWHRYGHYGWVELAASGSASTTITTHETTLTTTGDRS
jgi:uncharacterized protein YbcC (UPF0753/DUF2309 family)